MQFQLHITGTLLIILGLFHFFFPQYFKWKHELISLSGINREMMYVHTLFIALGLLLMGLLCLTSANDLLHTSLGKRISIGLAAFWIVRLTVQFFGYSSTLWKGKRFETSVHVLFSLIWSYFSGVFILAYLS